MTNTPNPTPDSLSPRERIEASMSKIGFDARAVLISIFQMIFLFGFIIIGVDLLFDVHVEVGPGGPNFFSWITGALIMLYVVVAYLIARFSGDLESLRSENAGTK